MYLKISGKDIVASFIVDRVVYFDNLNKDKMKEIKDKYNKYINADDSYWNIKENSNYGTFWAFFEVYYAPIQIILSLLMIILLIKGVGYLKKINNKIRDNN